jgi:hypothetical protein
MLAIMQRILALLALTMSLTAAPPTAEISNGQVHAKLYLPDAHSGFYQGTRFDWSGVIYSLEFQGHNYYGPWFQRTNPDVHDFIYEGADIVAGPCSAITGPVDEFAPLGWDEAVPGGSFIKIGIGALRKPADGKYDHYQLYPVANPGKWTIQTHPDSVDFIQQLSAAGYDYVYRKTVRLVPGKPEMVLEHSLKNRGTRAISTNVYNHNFLVLDNRPPGPGVTISVPFQIQSTHPPDKKLAEIRGNKIVYLTTLKDRNVAATPIEGFSDRANDHVIRIEDTRAGAGMKIEADRPLFRESLWSIRTVLAVEPFIEIVVAPGAEFTWKTTYDYYTLPAN